MALYIPTFQITTFFILIPCLLHMYKALFTDIDGVAVLSEALHQQKTIDIAANPLDKNLSFDTECGVEVHIERDWGTQLAGIGDHRLYEWLRSKNQRFPLSEESFLEKCEAYYLKRSDLIQPRPSYKEAVEYLRSIGMPLAAVSSGVRAQVDCNLNVANINSYLLFSLSGDDIPSGHTKPHPAPYLIALERLNAQRKIYYPELEEITPNECLVIEDSLSGAESGYKAGMNVIHWPLEGCPFYEKASFHVSHSTNLTDWFKNLLKK